MQVVAMSDRYPNCLPTVPGCETLAEGYSNERSPPTLVHPLDQYLETIWMLSQVQVQNGAIAPSIPQRKPQQRLNHCDRVS